jgi:acetolactate synthase-1/2/3 large subunit
VVVGSLERFGISIAFGIPGMWALPLYDALCGSRIRHVLVRHEQNAVFAADGYARVTGRPGLCLSTAGPGAVNLAAGIAVPFRDHSPVIALTGQVPSTEVGKGWNEDLDLQAIFRPVTKSTAQVIEPSTAYDIIASSYSKSLEGCPGPSHVSIPGDVQKMPSREKDYVPPQSVLEPDLAAVERVLEALYSSRSPLILAGWGAVLSGASGKVAALAESLPSYVATSYMGRGIIPDDHPLAIGPAGRRGSSAANLALSSCDLLLSLGCRLTNMTLDAPLRCIIAQVDVDEGNFSPMADVKVKGDVSSFIDAILPRVRSMGRRVLPVLSSPASAPGTTTAATAPWSVKTERSGMAAAFAKAISSVPDAIFTLDMGQHTIWLMQAIRVREPRRMIFSGNLSAMGYSLPAAMGAKLALPEKRVIAIMGDGGFQMSSPELSTLRENGINIAVCVFNNRALGLIRQMQEMVYGRVHGVDYLNPPDYVKLAEAHGVSGILADSPAEVAEALRVHDEPLVVEIPIPQDEGVDMSRSRIAEA